MAKTFTQLKKTVGSSSNSMLKNSKDEKKAFKDIKVSDYDFSLVKSSLEDNIRFGTLEKDLSSMGKTIEDTYNGWQTPETMNNARSSIESMQDRLRSYKEYQRLFGDKKTNASEDISKLQDSLRSALDGWDDLSKTYEKYKNADAYKNALKVSEEQAKKYESMKKDDLGAVQTEIADLEKIFGIAKEYDDKAIDFSKKSMNIKNPSAVDGFSKSLKKLTDERDAYLKSVGYESVDALKKALGEKKVYLKNATRIQDGVKLGSVGDANSEYYDSEYDKYVTKGKSIPYTEVGEETKKTTRGAGKARPTVRTIKSDTRMAAEALDAFIKNGKTVDSEGFDYSSLYDESAIFSLMTEKELKDLAYYIGKDKEDGGDRTSQYVESIKETLNYRRGNQISKGLEGKTFQQYLFGVEAGLDQFTSGVESLVSDKDYIPVSPIQYASGEVREDINYKHGTLGQGAYDLINTASNMAPSILASTVVSAATTPIGGAVVGNTLMGASAAGNARQEMLNLGYDKKQANIYAALVGTSEAVLQYALGGIGKLGGKITGKTLKALDSIDNAFFKFATKYEVSKLGEGFEEGLQSFLEPMFMNIAAGYDTGAEVDWGEVAYSGLLGYAMGGLFEGPGLAVNTYKEASFNKNMGQTIKANERVGEVFDIASNPEVASAYDTYTRYANKGINADNIKDSQLGRLYSSAKTDAVDTLKSKKTSEEQKQSALKTLAKLSTVETENTIKKAAKEFNVGEETKITDSGDAVDIKDLRVKGDTVTVDTEKGEISVNDITLTQNDAEVVAFAKEISKTDGEDVANLFLNQYDGKTEVEEYANSFNLISTLSKYESFSVDDIMDKKGVLSTEQVIEINKNVIIAQRKANIDAQNKAFAKMRENMHLEGYVDDSIIDYDSKSTIASGRVNWNSLKERQRAAVTFTKGLFTALGNKVIFVAKNKKFNGMYHVDGDTIFIDVYAGMDVVRAMGVDSILPTTAHELTHQMEVYSPEIFAEVKEIVLDTLEKSYRATSKDITRGDIIASEIDRLNKLHPEKEHTEKEAIGELVAKACEDMLSVSEEGKKLFNSLSEKEQRTLTEKIKDIIKKVSDWITNLLKSYSSNSEEAKALRSMKDAFDEVSKKWDMMLSDIAKQKKSVAANQSLEKSGAFKNETSAEGDVKYSDRPFAEQVDAVLSGEDAISTHLKISEHTPKILLDLGLSDKPLLITSVHTKSAVGYKVKGKNIHYVDKDVLKSLPKLVENPAMVMESTKQGSIVMFVNAVDVNKNPVLCSIKINGTGFYNNVELESNVVTSVYGKDTNPVGFVEKAVDENRLLYWDKKMSQKLFDIPGLQLPDNIYNLDSNTIIRKIGENVNTKFSSMDSTGRELSKGQHEYFKDSTVRDNDGSLKVMYRGDSSEFTVFDRKKTSHANLYGRGFYFTDSKAHATQYGDVREFYLDIKNPLSPKQNVITKKQLLNFLKAIENDGEDYDLYNYGEGATAESVLNSVWGKNDFAMLQDISASAVGDLVAAIELFNEVNGTTYDGIVLPTETVTFNSEQAKLTSNLNPTKDKDILFSMRDNVEETKELIAVHNMQVSELERTLDLGGLPMPSIAIIKAKSGHSEYGDVSLVFPKSTIDPKADKNNKVYGGDAWTPVYPTIEYKPNEKVTKKINDKYYELSRKFGYDESRPLYNYVYDLEEKLNRHKGETELINELYDDTKMMQLYLLDSGKSKIETIKKETRTELTDAEVEMNEFFINELGANVVDEVMWDGNGTPMSYRKNYLSKYGDSIREAYKKLLSEVYQFTDEQVQNVLDSTKTADYLRFMRDAHKYRQNGRVTTKTEDDYTATKEAIRDASGDGYRGWIDSLFKGIEEKSGIRNNVDYFTNSGNRRSWEALHWENNLENVVKVMKSQDNGVAAIFSGHAIWAVSAKDYRSVDEMKADSDRLKRLSEEEYNEIKEGFGTRFQEIAESIMSKTESNPFIAADNAMECIIEAVRNSKTKSGILKNLKEYPQLTVTETTVDDIVSLVSDISNMPTEYFEAKPKRAVGLNEIATAIIPDATNESTKTRLNDMGIKFVEYESGNEQSRLKALNSLDNVMFSDRDSSYTDAVENEEIRYGDGDSEGNTLTAEQQKYTYEALVAKRETGVITLESVTPLEENKYKSNYDLFAKDMRDIAAEKGNPKNTEQKTHLYCKDLNGNVLITKQSFKHGAARLDNAYISVCKSIADILNTSIVVNELAEREKTNGAYVLLGLAENKDSYVVVRSIVNKKTWNLEEYEELYAIKKKSIEKGDVGLKAPALHLKSGFGTSPTISISNFLEFVNSQPLGSSVLSLDVVKNLNSQRAFDENVTPYLLYSDREDTSVYDLMGEKERLLKENEKFKAEVERLNERLKIERKVTNGNFFNENQLGAAAGHLRNISKSLIAKDKLVEQLKGVYSFIAHSPELTWEEVFERCYNIADAMLEEAKPEIVVDDYSKRILNEIRTTKISLDKEQKKEAEYIFGKNWNRHFFNRVGISDNGIPIDMQWQEWSSLYPDIFEPGISDGDMIGELDNIINTLKDASETVMEYNEEEQKRWLAREIYNQYWNVSPIRTTADKYDRQIRRLNFEHRRIMTEFREEYNSRMKDKLKAEKDSMKEKQKKLVAKIRERKEKEIAAAKEHGKERLSKYKENAERKTRIQSITSNALSLNELLMKNSKDKHVPEVLREPVANLLQAIDFSSKRLLDKGVPTQKDISLSKTLGKVKDMMVKASNAHNELVELYGHGLDDEIESMIDSVDDIMRNVGDNEFILNKMSITDLQTLDKMVKTIRHAVNKMNKFHIVNHAKGIANLSQESVLYLDSLGKGKVYDGLRGKTKKLLNWNNALPYYVFKRYGSGGMKVYEALQDGWDKFAFNTKKIIDFANDTYSSKEVKAWSEEVKTFKILIPASEFDLEREDYAPQYQEVQLTVPQIMSMYCLNKREQARGHLFQGGIRVADFKDKKGSIVSQSDGIIFTEKDVRTIFDSLTDRQKAVADKLQGFMNTVCADWGNDVSMARFGYKAFGEENYFPIQSDENNLAVNDETEQLNSLFKLLNMSFTKKPLENANNRIVISDIFDVFAQHTSDMSKYNALALPVLDSFKWYNYTEKQDIAEGTFKTSGVKQSIEKAFGKDGQNYFTTFLKDINGSQETDREQLSKSFMRNYKIASVGANLRVIALQPTSYVRASAVIGDKYLVKALGHKPKISKAETHCGIALWKSMGYFDTNIQRGVTEQIKHDETWRDKATDLSMKGAELADKLTWGYLWNACELEIRDKRKDLRVGSKEFYDAIGKRLREVIYATQVVDSTMTRSQMMRSTKMHDQIMTNFASEPTLAYNMLQDAYMRYSLDARQMGKGKAIKKNAKRIARILYAYTMTNAVAALVESAFDALRDDDDEEMDMATLMKLYLSNFASDMSITGKIPYIKEIHSLIKGYSVSRSELAWMESSYKAVTGFYKNLHRKGNPVTTMKNAVKTISYLSRLPFYNLYRDTMAILNKLDLFTEDELNEMFEDFFLYGILGEDE